MYSGIRRGPDARTKFQVSIARLRNIQVFVAGDVVRPGSYQISAAATVLNALYAAGGPTTNGSFRRVEVRRGGKLADSVDVYEYLTKGMNPTGRGSRAATWCSSRCTADSPRWWARSTARRSTSCCRKRRCATW